MLPRKAPNDPETLPMGIQNQYVSCWTILGPFLEAHWGHVGFWKGPRGVHVIMQGHFGRRRVEWPRMAQNHQNGSKSPEWLKMTLKHFPWLYYMIICHVGPAWTLFRGPRGPHNGTKQHQNGLKWLKITRIAQNGTAWPQMTLKHFQWVYYMIICHVGPPWALFRGPRGPHNDPK